MPKLKVFRTATGFHDAYVAAPSRAAALRAWGSDKDLFARGAAEEVFDPALIEDALASPGTVIKRLRGTAAEQLAALPPTPPKRAKPAPEPEAPPRKGKTAALRKAAPPPPPKPSRAPVETADAALAEAETKQKAALAALAEREAALARERRALEREQANELRRLTRDRDAAASAYDDALRRWHR